MFDQLNTTDVGIVAVILLLVIKELISALTKMGSNKDDRSFENLKETIYETAKQTSELHDWHGIKDSTGRPIWYGDSNVTKELLKALTGFQESTNKTIELLAQLCESQKDLVSKLAAVEDQMLAIQSYHQEKEGD